MLDKIYDIAVIGGGINGAGIARDAVGRGLSVLLAEKGDLAGATSSASTKLIHGGLRYLEHGAFRLVRESLREREVLLKAAPHLVRPLRFVLPHHEGLRPWWLIRAGLFLYDHIGGRRMLPPTRVLDLRNDPAGEPLRPGYTRAFEYSDCWADDARLVILNALGASRLGATVLTRTRCDHAEPDSGLWRLRFEGGKEARARALVNATGPWVSDFLQLAVGRNIHTPIRMVKGSHIVTRRLFTHDLCYIFQNTDGRICFAIPYERDFTLIGTTDLDYTDDPDEVATSAEEEIYLLDSVSRYLRRPVEPADVVWRYSGVRPLRDDGKGKAQDATRDYVLELDGTPPLLSVYGGKITTYRKLAEAVLAKLAPFFPRMLRPWTALSPLPGGWESASKVTDEILHRYPFLDAATAGRFTHSYGTLSMEVLGDASRPEDLGARFGADLTAREVDWLKRHEWARTADDILWRRTKLGLRFTTAERRALEHAMES